MSAAAKMIERITRRIPSPHASVARVYGGDAFLFGIDFALADWTELCDEVGVHDYERGEPLTWDGLKLQRSATLEPGHINAVVFVPNQLVVRPTTLTVLRNRCQVHCDLPRRHASKFDWSRETARRRAV